MPSISIRFPDDVHAALARARTEDERSFNGEVIWMIRQHLTARGFLPAPENGASAPDPW